MLELTVLSFNIRGSFVMHDGENIWEKRAALNVQTIRRLAADLICFQELQLGNLVTYEKELADYSFSLGPKYNDRAPHCYPAVFWKPEKLRKLGSEEFWLSGTPQRHSRDWNTACIRSAQQMRFACAPDGPEFVLLNTHLDHRSELARVEGAKLIVERLRAFRNDPTLVTADFNCNPGSAAYTHFHEHGFEDTLLAAGQKDTPEVFTFHEFKGVRHATHGRIDWILTRPGARRFVTRGFEIVRDAQPPLYPSDHYPIVAKLELKS